MVDQRGAAEFTSIASAVEVVEPGDTIRLAPGSGPYREQVVIRKSGIPGHPIVFDGSGETVTGFDVLEFRLAANGVWRADLASYFRGESKPRGFTKIDGKWTLEGLPSALPFVLAYRGERIPQERATGQLARYGRLTDDRNSLELLRGVSPEGWEISTRGSTVAVLRVSHHQYQNVVASGALNDGFNLHGEGVGLSFYNIVGRNNFDEGFSAHDSISCSVEYGRFYGNDNGIVNIGRSHMKARQVAVYGNLGMGMYFREAKVNLEDVDVRRNGAVQFQLTNGAEAHCGRVTISRSEWDRKPWLTTQESARVLDSVLKYIDPESRVSGEEILEL